MVDPETLVYAYGAGTGSSLSALLYPGKRQVWRDNNGKWYVLHQNLTVDSANYNLLLTTNNTASGAWNTTKLCGSEAGWNGLITTQRCYFESSWMDKFNNTLHVVFIANLSANGNWTLLHSQCYINNVTSYTLAGCWKMANGTAGYDIVAGNSTHGVYDPDIAIDRDQNMYIVYKILSATPGNYSVQMMKYNRTAGWTGPVAIWTYAASKTGGGSIWPLVDVASTGTVHVMYLNQNNTGVADNSIEHVKSMDGGATWTRQSGAAGYDQVYTNMQCIAMGINSDDQVMMAGLTGSNTILYNLWDDTATTISAASYTVSSDYNNCPAIGEAANGGMSVFWAQRTGDYLQYFANKTKESNALMSGTTVYRDPVGTGTTNRSGDYSAVERKATIYSTSGNLGFVASQYNGYASIWHDTRTIYNSGTSINFGDQKYEVMPLKWPSNDSIGADWQWATKHTIIRDSKGYYYLLMLGDWNETYTTAGGSIYLSKSIEPFADSNGIVYFNSPKKIIGYNNSNATITVGSATLPTFMTMVSGWIDLKDDHLHLAYSGFRNYTGGGTPSGPYNNITQSARTCQTMTICRAGRTGKTCFTIIFMPMVLQHRWEWVYTATIFTRA
jgi:hypothetical protein